MVFQLISFLGNCRLPTCSAEKEARPRLYVSGTPQWGICGWRGWQAGVPKAAVEAGRKWPSPQAVEGEVCWIWRWRLRKQVLTSCRPWTNRLSELSLLLCKMEGETTQQQAPEKTEGDNTDP
jgi:hypothetical protein